MILTAHFKLRSQMSMLMLNRLEYLDIFSCGQERSKFVRQPRLPHISHNVDRVVTMITPERPYYSVKQQGYNSDSLSTFAKKATKNTSLGHPFSPMSSKYEIKGGLLCLFKSRQQIFQILQLRHRSFAEAPFEHPL